MARTYGSQGGRVVTRDIGNLRGFSTDSSFIRPAYVAERAINIQRAPDRTFQLRRGYQAQIAAIGGMGMGTFDNPATDEIQTVTVGMDGFLYNKLQKQIYFYYDGQVTGDITNVSQANPAVVTDNGHGLITGAVVIIRNVGGMTNINNKTFTITRIDADNYSLNGVDSTAFPAYTTGGSWSIAFADMRYLTFTIFTDPRFLNTNPGWSIAPWSISPWGATGMESITCNITVNRAAQVNGALVNGNTVSVYFGHEIATTDVIQFYSKEGVLNQRTVTSVTSTSITFDGYPVNINDKTYISEFYDIQFGKGFDVNSPYLISEFINLITDPTTGIYGLQIAINGESDLPAAFLQILEPVIIDSNTELTLDYWYWQQVNYTISPPFPGSANIKYQNSPEFENAAMAAFDDVIYITNGWDYPQKYDGQTVYRAGMPEGERPSAIDNTTAPVKPFSMDNVYQYAITYEQIDYRGHIVEGVISDIRSHTVGTTFSAIDVTVTNLQSSLGSNWNTNGARAVGGTATVYGPDSNGYYYDNVALNSGSTFKLFDQAYYLDTTCAVVSMNASGVIVIPVNAGHGILPGNVVYFTDTTPALDVRQVASITATTITIKGANVSVTAGTDIMAYKVSTVFGGVAIVNGNQSNVNIVNVFSGHSLQIGNVVDFIDSSNLSQERTVTNTSGTSITLSGIPVSVSSAVLINSTSTLSLAANLQRLNANGATLGAAAPLSNNLRINIYRTEQGLDFNNAGTILYLVASIPNDSSGNATQTYTDMIADIELKGLAKFLNPQSLPNPPPISKYVKAFGNQLFYGGGERGNPENSDRVFFSEGNQPESVDAASNFFNVPNVDDDVTGLGVSGSTFITTKNHSLWAATGNFLSGQIDIVQIAPGTNIGCVAHATIVSVGTLLYFLHTNGVYAITENQLYPTDAFGNPIPISFPIDKLFRETNFLPNTRYVYKRAVAVNYTKDNQYLLFLPCEDVQSTIRTANANSAILVYDYQEKNWFYWTNMNAAGGMIVMDDDLYFQERRYSSFDGNTANLYKQHRFYRLVDHADHAGSQRIEWRSSWEDLGQPEIRKKFSKCILLMDRLSSLLQYNQPEMIFSTYLNRLSNLQNTIAPITTVDNIRNSGWSTSPWGWNFWSGYEDTFVTINLKQGTVAKSMQIGFTMQGINMDIRFAGFQLEIIPENRKTVVR